MVATISPQPSSQLLHFKTTHSTSLLSPFQVSVSDAKTLWSCPTTTGGSRRRQVAAAAGGVRCMAVGAAPEAETKRRSKFEIQTLTGWLLQQEQKGVIDAELTIVLSSISMACKQIGSLVQRASISNLTGVQGAVNVQGEDQKKLDVVSNEVYSPSLHNPLTLSSVFSLRSYYSVRKTQIMTNLFISKWEFKHHNRSIFHNEPPPPSPLLRAIT